MAARAQGLDWSLFLGVSSRAAGTAPADDPSWVQEVVIEPRGVPGVTALKKTLCAAEIVAAADLVVSLTPQCDMALALGAQKWVAYTRGLPWPARGEAAFAKRLPWRVLETLALLRATEVWATTRVLASDLGRIRSHLVPAGIAPVNPVDGPGNTVVWAARYDADKNPWLFLDALRGLRHVNGAMYGSGPLREQLAQAAPENVEVCGWKSPTSLWDDAAVYVGTSTREAFGRSAIEAAMAGVPVVLSQAFGAADLLYTDASLRSRFVLPVNTPGSWSNAIETLMADESLRREVIAHLHANAGGLTIDSSVAAMLARIRQLA